MDEDQLIEYIDCLLQREIEEMLSALTKKEILELCGKEILLQALLN